MKYAVEHMLAVPKQIYVHHAQTQAKPGTNMSWFLDGIHVFYHRN